MSQNDMVIANALAATLRGDLNAALGAQASNQMGTGQPPTTYPGQFWMDSTSHKLKIRTEADDAWIKLGELDQTNNRYNPNISNLTFQADDLISHDGTKFTRIGKGASLEYLRMNSAGNALIWDTPDVFGFGQQWQTPSRNSSTTYQNTTGKPIMCAIRMDGGSTQNLEVSHNNSTWFNVARFPNSVQHTGYGVIPDDHYYKLDGGSIAYWRELR